MDQRVCVITGASRGIGLATALRFARAGYAIVAAARGAPDLARAAEQIRALGAIGEPVALDLGRPAAAQQLIDTAVARFGRVDVLVNNAACGPLARLDELEPATFDQVIALNIAGVFRSTQAVWPVMKRQRSGVIVNVSSVASVDPFPGFAVYGASKAWVNSFSQAVAAEGAPYGVRVFCVAPGAVETRMLRSAFPNFPSEQTLAAEDVAAVIHNLCDPTWAHAVGQTIFVRK